MLANREDLKRRGGMREVSGSEYRAITFIVTMIQSKCCSDFCRIFVISVLNGIRIMHPGSTVNQ
jgi:hypothetical protein